MDAASSALAAEGSFLSPARTYVRASSRVVSGVRSARRAGGKEGRRTMPSSSIRDAAEVLNERKVAYVGDPTEGVQDFGVSELANEEARRIHGAIGTGLDIDYQECFEVAETIANIFLVSLADKGVELVSRDDLQHVFNALTSAWVDGVLTGALHEQRREK
jgi:hypothetical protein